MQPSRKARPLLLFIAYLGFISLGLPDTLIGVAWPSVRETFGRQQGAIALIFFGAGCSYFLSSFFTGRLLGRFGIGLLLAGSSALVALSGFGYGLAPVWMAFAACSLLHGLGSGAIDAGLNHYVAHHFSARHMTWLHACYTLGATLGPLIMTSVLLRHGAWRPGYLVVAGALSVLALLFVATRKSWEESGGETSGATQERPVNAGQALRYPMVWLHIFIFFAYTGLEATVGQWSFTVLTESRNLSPKTAGLWVALYWGSILAGRILFGFIVDRIGIDRLLRASVAATIAGTIGLAWNPVPWSAAVALVVTGLGLAAIYPCLMTRTPQRLGTGLAAHAIGFQVSAAILGAAALPSLSGFLAERLGLEVVAKATVLMALAVGGLHEWLLRTGMERKGTTM